MKPARSPLPAGTDHAARSHRPPSAARSAPLPRAAPGLGALLVALAAVVLIPVAPRLRAADNADSPNPPHPIVSVVVAARSNLPTELLLPAALQAYQDTPIYARTTGYIAKWTADIGDRVKAGETLAVIDGPDLDQQLTQAKAQLGQAQANLELARISAERWKELGKQNAVAQQDVDTRTADYAARQADVAAAKANVDRLSQLKDYQQVTAPYDGVVTARNAQVGALINAGAGVEIYHIAETDILRVYVNVPQTYVRSIKPGLLVDVLVPEFPGKTFKGKVVRFAGALDGASRTLLVEIQLPNPTGTLYAGMFGQVRFSLLAAQPAIVLPSNAAIIRGDGTLVATVGADNRIKLVHVVLGRDFGTQIEILDGLAPGARVVANPSDSLTDGLLVDPILPSAVKS